MNKQQTTSTKQLQEGVRDEIERREWNYKTRGSTRVLLTALIHVLRTNDGRKNIFVYVVRNRIFYTRIRIVYTTSYIIYIGESKLKNKLSKEMIL